MATTSTLPSIGLAKLSNASYAAFMRAFSQLVQQAPLEKLGLKADEWTPFWPTLAQLLDANRQIRKDELTTELQELDKQRDTLLSYVFSKILNETNAPEDAIKQAAEALLGLRELYLDLPKKAQREETILIQGFLADAEKADFAAHFTTLGLNATLTKIKTINTEYETKLATRSAKQVENPLLPIKKLRESLSASYQLLSMKAFAFNLITPTSESQTFILRLNKLIEDTNLARKQHKAQLGVRTEEGGWKEENTSANPWTPQT